MEREKIELEERVKQQEMTTKTEIDRANLYLEGKLSLAALEKKEPVIAPSEVTSVKLPKLDFPKFTGDVLKWKEFSESFEAAIDRKTTLTSVDKLNYLKSKLDGDALTVIRGLELTNESYEVAVKLLKERFGDRQVILDAHFSRLTNMVLSSSYYPKLRAMVDEFEMHIRSLESLGENVETAQMITLFK